MATVYFTGDDWTLNMTIKQNGAVYDASAGTIKAAVVHVANGVPSQEIADTAQSSGTTGADWANGLIVVKFPAAATAAVTKTGQTLLLELQVTDAGGEKITWPRQAFQVDQGTIS